jgi:hypothetical protein
VKYRSSYDTSYRILATLAEHTEYAQYDMPSVIGKDYRTVLRHVHHLRRRNLIRLVRTEPASKGGKDRNIYALTFPGLIAFLKRPRFWDRSDLVDDIAEKYAAYLPLVFGKWELYQRRGFKDVIATRVQSVITDPTLPNPLTRAVSERDDPLVSIELHTTASATSIDPEFVTERVLTTFAEPDVFYQLLTISARDPDLRRFFERYLQRIAAAYSSSLKTIHDWILAWDAIKEA